MAMGKLIATAIKAAKNQGRKPNFGAIKTKLEKKIREGTATKEDKGLLKEIRKKDAAATKSQKVKQSQSSRKTSVSLAGLKKTEKPTKISFVDEQTGEVFEVSKSKFEGMTPRQKTQMLENFKARSRLGEDLSDEAMAKQRKRLAAARAARKKKGSKTVKKQMGGNMGSKPKGVGCAQRGYGKAMR